MLWSGSGTVQHRSRQRGMRDRQANRQTNFSCITVRILFVLETLLRLFGYGRCYSNKDESFCLFLYYFLMFGLQGPLSDCPKILLEWVTL